VDILGDGIGVDGEHYREENNKLPNLDIEQEGNLDTWP
jgi:hypothetical protein